MENCILCGAEIAAGQLCKSCAELLKENAGTFEAMFNKTPVEHDGIKYGCISAFTIRARSYVRYTMERKIGRPCILQVELMSKDNHVIIANPKDVKITKGGTP